MAVETSGNNLPVCDLSGKIGYKSMHGKEHVANRQLHTLYSSIQIIFVFLFSLIFF